MRFGNYQISNLFIGAVLVTAVAGLSIATGAADSVADVVSDTFKLGGNASQAPDTNSDSSETGQNTDTTKGQDSDDRGNQTEPTDSIDPTNSNDSSELSDSNGSPTDPTSSQGSETGNQQGIQQREDQQQGGDESISYASILTPSNGQTYNTAFVDIAAEVAADNASYEVRFNDSLRKSGRLDGSRVIYSTLSPSDGVHNIKVLIKRSGDILTSDEAQFSVSTSRANTTGTEPSTNTSGSASISLFEPGSQVSTNTVPLNVTLDASNASYQVNVDGDTEISGSVDGSKTLDQDLNIESGTHELEVVVSDSTGTLASDSVSFTVDTGDTSTQRTGFYSPDNLTAGGTALVRLYNDQGDAMKDATVTVGSLGDFTTNQFGEIEFQVPFQDTITASSTNYEKTFDITQTAIKPEITLVNPIDTISFDTPTGTSKNVTFEADIEITENSGTASLIIDSSQAYTQDLSSGENTISTTQGLAGGTHNWQVDIDTPEYDVSSSSRSLTVNEVEVQNGLSLQNNATAGEYNYVSLYDAGEPVEGAQITVDGDSIGSTDSNGEVGFEVPNEDIIVVRSPDFSESFDVQGYVDPEKLELIKPEFDSEYTASGNTATVPVEFTKPASTSYQILLDGKVVKNGEGGETVNTEIQVAPGIKNLNIRSILENGDTIKTQDTRIQVNQN